MPSDLDVQSDPVLHLLTDALRAGPGSPAWHQALEKLGEVPPTEADQYRAIMHAREALESGKAYRSVRAGPGFTRKVLDGLGKPVASRLPVASVVALASIAVVLIVVGWLVWMLVLRSSTVPDTAPALGGLYFGSPVASAVFDGNLPDGFRAIGRLKFDFTENRARLAREQTGPIDKNVFLGGGIVLEQPLQPDAVHSVEVEIRTPSNNDNVIPQVFLTDKPEFLTDRATSPNELAWFLKAGRPTVALPDGRLVGTGDRLTLSNDAYLVRIVLDRNNARVESAGQLVWSGPHGLSPDAPRYAGVRILQKADGRRDSTSFSSVRVLKP